MARTQGQRNPFIARDRGVDALASAKEAAARAARANGAIPAWQKTPAGTFLTFDAPGAVYGATHPTAVSASGIIVGYYDDASGLTHGFLRTPHGAFYNFDVPGAIYGTYPAGVNDEGAIAGGYADNVGSGYHSFIRYPFGRLLTFDPPVPNTGSGDTAINRDGTSTGSYSDENNIGHGYLRTRGGKFITYAAAGATSTYPSGITADGTILGLYHTTKSFGFLRTPSGTFHEITGPGGLGSQDDYYNAGPALSMNRFGEIAGTYFQPITGNPFGGDFFVFVRSRDGKYVTFNAANYAPCCIWSAPSGINDAGTIVGSFNDGLSVYHGFWRTRGGTVTTFDVPSAGTKFNQGTQTIGITASGVIAGSYRDSKTLTHGYLFRPKCGR